MAPKIPQIVNCGSSTLLEYELEHVRHDLSLNETEETWDKIARAVQYLEAIAKGTTQDLFPELVSAVKLLARPITNALLSDRSRLSGHAAELVTTLATCFKRAFDPLISAFVPSLLQGCARSNKVFVSKSKACLMAIVEHVQSPLLLPHFRSSVSDKSLSLRLIATELVLACMNCFNPPDLETVSRAEDIETVIRATATDASAEVRKCSRSVFEAYKILLPGRLDDFISPMTPTMKRYLAVTSKEMPSVLHSSSTSSRKPETSTATSSKTTLSSSKSTRDLKRSAAVASGSTKPESGAVQHRTAGITAEPQVRKERPPPSGPVRPPFTSRDTMPPPAKLSSDEKRAAPSRPIAHQSQVFSKPPSVHLSRPATASAFSHVSQVPESATVTSISRTSAQRPDPVFRRPASPSGIKNDAVIKSSASRPNNMLAVEDLRKSTEERSTKGPRRVPKPPPPEEKPEKTSQSSRSAKLGTSGGKSTSSDRQVLSRSADANARKDALRAKLDAQAALGVTERRPKGHARAVSQPANMISKEKKERKPEAGKPVSQAMPPPPPPAPRSASTSARPGLSAPTLAQLARMKETAKESKARPVKTFTKKVKGAQAIIKPLSIRKGRRKSLLKAPDAAALVTPAEATRTEITHKSEEDTVPSSATSEPELPAHHPDAHDDNVSSLTEDEPTIREIAVLQSLVVTPPPDSPESSSTSSSSEPRTASSSPAYDDGLLNTPPRALFPTSPLQPAATPISALLFSIERGFVAPTPSHSMVADNTLPYPDNDDAAEESEDEESVLKNIDFAMNGVDACGKILQSPRKKGVNSENRSPLGYVDTNCT